MTRNNTRKSALANTIVNKEIIVIESDTDTDTDEVGAGMLALCGVENSPGDDDTLAKKPVKYDVAKTIVKQEIKMEPDIDEVGGTMLALCVQMDALGNGSLVKTPENSAVAKTILKENIIEIESDTDTDEVGGRMLAPCGAENASPDDVLANNPKTSAVAKTIVTKEIKTEPSIDEAGGRSLALGEVNASGDDTLAKNSAVAKAIVNQEVIEIESDTDAGEVGGRMLALCSAEDASGDDVLARGASPFVKSEVAKTIVKKEIIEIESATDTDTDEVGGRMLALAKDGETNRTNMQIVCADDYDSGLVHDLEYKKYLAHYSEIGNLYMLDDNVRDSSPVRIMYNVDHEVSDRSKSKALIIKKSRAGRKAKFPMVSSVSKRLKIGNGRADQNLISRTVLRTQETQQMKGNARRGRKSSVAKDCVELKPTSYVRDTKQKNGDARRGRKTSLAKKDVILKHTRNDESQTIFRASKRLKTENGRSDHNWTSKSIPVVNTNGTKQTKYADIFHFVIMFSKDLEDGVDPDDLFNSSYSKRLMELLRNPYDEEEYLRLYTEASLKRPLTRSRQLRDGREIEYNVEDQLAPSYLEKYTDFNKIYHRYQKDLPRSLNLLRGFFFYLENIVLEGAFKPWLHEKSLINLCVDARECIDMVGNK
ncbi:PREDICTED: uncharacterized protein LOC104753889 [Camelina sativa]|uniref:Uncharacterized protein LOC104753889 n=1 Tax=Camelina sativa TaxID=90675 RepID=A0ABM0WPU9_CAMSA|nr:PREDICTED: uncharacterized protein LOC104753889 [Camelina sativa]